jgi:signal transduction histidine kinase/CheY-like chemotaxis protein
LKKLIKLTEAEILRQAAEELLSKSQLGVSSPSSESDVIKLSHELAVHQIELEIQNQELLEAKHNLEGAVVKYTGLYDFAPTGYLTLSKDGEIMQLNFYVAKIIGKERIHLIKSLFGFFVSKETTLIFNNFLRDIYNYKVKQSCEVTIQTGDTLPVIVYLVGIFNESSKYADISMVDITERKLAEENLKNALDKLTLSNKELGLSLQLNDDKDLFISALAHDLRNPFGVLFGYTELLLGDIHTLTISEIENLVGEIYNSSHNTFNLLEDLLKWARVRTGKFPFEPQKISFKDICEEIVKILNPSAITKNIVFVCSATEDITVIADVDMLKAILRNLVSNAIKFTNTNGKLKLSAEKVNQDILFSVSDNGVGMDQERLKNLFDISHLQTTDGTAKEKGTGFGLFLCKEFVDRMGGKIWVKSEIGKGSVFYFTIPTTIEPPIENIGSNSEEAGTNLKILIADDNPALSFLLGNMLKGYCREILYAENGEEALELYKRNPDINLVLLDLNMPKCDGYQVTRQIRKFNAEVIIIVQTADSYSDVVQKATKQGINDFFFKPYNRSFLNKLIIKYFKKSE